MTSTETLAKILSEVLPKEKIYPDVVPAEINPPFVAYSEQSQPSETYDGNAGDVDTSVVTVVASTKREARRLADLIVEKLDRYSDGEFVFYFMGRSFVMYADERLSSYELTFNIV